MPVAFLLGRGRKPIPFAFKLVLSVNVLKKNERGHPESMRYSFKS